MSGRQWVAPHVGWVATKKSESTSPPSRCRVLHNTEGAVARSNHRGTLTDHLWQYSRTRHCGSCRRLLTYAAVPGCPQPERYRCAGLLEPSRHDGKLESSNHWRLQLPSMENERRCRSRNLVSLKTSPASNGEPQRLELQTLPY